MSSWTYLERKQHREQNNIPAWVPIGDDDPNFKRLFIEDDANTPDKERGAEAWERIFEIPLGACKPKGTWDGGDCEVTLYEGNRVLDMQPEGVTIWQWLPPRKFKDEGPEGKPYVATFGSFDSAGNFLSDD